MESLSASEPRRSRREGGADCQTLRLTAQSPPGSGRETLGRTFMLRVRDFSKRERESESEGHSCTVWGWGGGLERAWGRLSQVSSVIVADRVVTNAALVTIYGRIVASGGSLASSGGLR